MSQTSIKFGTSGLRGLAAELCGRPAFAYTTAFLQTLRQRGAVSDGQPIYIGRDLRASSPEIAGLCAGAIATLGFKPVDCGALPTPALAYVAGLDQVPLIVVTGSHIPHDRNGLKFYRADGEIDKQDEAAISDAHDRLPQDLAIHRLNDPDRHAAAHDLFLDRLLAFCAPESLRGLHVGLYQHTSVARDMLAELLTRLGAKVTGFGRSDEFVPIDTEALRPQDIALLAHEASKADFDAIISTDGDADRPLITDEHGQFIRGDLVGAMTASWLGADIIIIPVTANSALDHRSEFSTVRRTRVGSPYVIAAMQGFVGQNAGTIVGFETNGGVLLASAVERHGRRLLALPTRDAFLPIIACLHQIKERGLPLSAIAGGYGFNTALSDRLQNVPGASSTAFLASMADSQTARRYFPQFQRSDLTDGVQIHLDAGQVVHFRASGNAPELRCYVEAESQPAAELLLRNGLALAKQAIMEVT